MPKNFDIYLLIGLICVLIQIRTVYNALRKEKFNGNLLMLNFFIEIFSFIKILP